MVWNVEHLEHIHAHLRSEKITTRKEALKRLRIALEDREFLERIDQRTCELKASGEVTDPFTWPALVHTMCIVVEDELLLNRNKARPDSSAAKTLCETVAKAESGSCRSSQSRLMLWKKAKHLYRHAAHVMARMDVDRSIFVEYCTLLARYLLPIREYNELASVSSTSSILQCIYLVCEKMLHELRGKDGTRIEQELFRVLDALASIVKHSTSDISGGKEEKQNFLIRTVKLLCKVLLQFNDQGRIAVKSMEALNEILLRDGGEIFHVLDEVDDTVEDALNEIHDTTKKCLRTEFRAELCRFFVIQLKLRGKVFVRARYIWSSLSQELNDETFSTTSFYLQRNDSWLVQASAAAAVLSDLQGNACVAAPRDKRTCIQRPLQELKHNTLANPSTWAPVVCTAIQQHGAYLDEDTRFEMLSAVSRALQRCLKGNWDASVLDPASWFLRWAQELAFAWKVHEAAPRSGMGRAKASESSVIRNREIHDASECWKQIFKDCVDHLMHHNESKTLAQECLLLMAVCMSRNLVDHFTLPPSFWLLEYFVPDVNRSGLDLLLSAFVCVHEALQGRFIGFASESDHNVELIFRNLLMEIIVLSSCKESRHSISSFLPVAINCIGSFLQIEGFDDIGMCPWKSLYERWEHCFLPSGIENSLVHIGKRDEFCCPGEAAESLGTSQQKIQLLARGKRLQDFVVQFENFFRQRIQVESGADNSSMSTFALFSVAVLLAVRKADGSKGLCPEKSYFGMNGVLLHQLNAFLGKVTIGNLAKTDEACVLLDQCFFIAGRESFEHSVDVRDSLLKDIASKVNHSLQATIESTIADVQALTMPARVHPGNRDDWMMGGEVSKEMYAPSGQHISELEQSICFLLKFCFTLQACPSFQLEECLLHSVSFLLDLHIDSSVQQSFFIDKVFSAVLPELCRVKTACSVRFEVESLNRVFEYWGIRKSTGSLLVAIKCLNELTLRQTGIEQESPQIQLTLKLIEEIHQVKGSTLLSKSWFLRTEILKLYENLLRIHGKKFAHLAEKLALSLGDASYCVRCHAINCSMVLFTVFTDIQGVFKRLAVHLPALSMDPSRATFEEMETSMFFLLQVLRTRPELEDTFVHLVASWGAQSSQLTAKLIPAIFGAAAKESNHPSICSYLGHHMPSLIYRWLDTGLPLRTLKSLGEAHVPAYRTERAAEQCAPNEAIFPVEFIKTQASTILPILLEFLCLSPKADAKKLCADLEFIAEECQWSEDRMLLHFLPEVVGYLLLDSTREVRSIIVESRLSKHFDSKMIEKVLSERMHAVVSTMILWAGPSKMQKPFYSKDAIQQGLERVGNMCELPGNNTTQKLLSPSSVGKILLHVHSCIYKCHNSRHATRFLYSVDALVDVLGSATSVPSTFIYLTQLLVRSLGWSEAQELCCRNLQVLIRNQLLDHTTAICVEDVIQTIMSALFSALKSCQLPCRRRALLSLVRSLTVELPSHSLYMLNFLEPPPHLCDLEEISAFYHNNRTAPTAADELHRLAQSPLTLQVGVHESTIDSIGLRALQLVESNKAEATETGGNLDRQKDVKKIACAAWRLLRKSKLLNSIAMEDVACRILAKLGPGFITTSGQELGVLNQASFALEEADQILSNENRNVVNLLQKGDKERAKLTLAVLLVLYGLLCDSDPSVVKQSMNCLKALMVMKEGKAATEVLPEKVKLTLVQFATSSADESDVLEWAKKDTENVPDLNDDSIWDSTCATHEVYVCSLVRCLLGHTDDLLLLVCSRVCRVSISIAELLMPYCLASLALSNGPDGLIQKVISKKVIQHIFDSTTATVHVKRMWLSALHHLRILHQCDMASMASRGFSKDWRKVYWLELEYLDTADIALECDAPFTAFLYTEQWYEAMELSFGLSPLNDENFGCVGKICDILYRSLESIGDTDSVRALDQMGPIDSQVRLFQHEGQWSKALQLYDLMLDNDMDGVDTHRLDALRSLKEIGCLHMLKRNSLGASELAGSRLIQELQHEAAWRSCRWEKLPIETRPQSIDIHAGVKPTGFHGLLQLSMEALQSYNYDMFDNNIHAARSIVVREMVEKSFEGASGLAEQIVQLQMLDDLHVASEARRQEYGDPYTRIFSSSSSKDTEMTARNAPVVLERMFTSWKERKPELISLYSTFEPRLAVQTSIYRIFGCKVLLRQHLRLVTSTARKVGRLHDATTAMFHLARLNDEPNSGETDVVSKWTSGLALCKVEEAKLLWANGYQQMATNVLRSLFFPKVLDRSIDQLYIENQVSYAKAVSLTGKWLAEISGENTQTILQHYLAAPADALKLLENNVGPNCCRSLFRLAQYADFLYKNLHAQLRSDEWKSSEAVRKQKSAELARLRERESEIEMSFASGKMKQNALRDIARHLIPLQRQCDLDEGQAKRVMKDRDRYRNIAMTGYRQCLAAGSRYDLQGVFRLCALWLSNPSEAEVNKAMSTAFDRVATFKWLPLVYQIASRTSTLKGDSELHQSGFHQVQHRGLQLIANDHPYHTLLQLYALKNGAEGKGKEAKDQVRGHRFQDAITRTIDRDKILGAQEILEGIRSMSNRNHEIMRQMEMLIDGYVLLSNIPVKKKETGGYASLTMPREVRSMQGLDYAPVLTAPLLARPDANYHTGSFPTFQCFTEKISIANGITAPKLLQCQGSDGYLYRQLLKSGTDDLRQDATMQQLFGLVNSLLGDCPTAASRNLRVAVYKVIPFSPVCGLLEWVDNTVTLGDYLLGAGRRGGAHVRYRPKDITYSQCHQMLKNVSREEELRKAYDKVCSMFKPVLRHFFLEMFYQPPDWYKHRLAYTRSVAVNSIVGYVVGLGDRHSFNILIDKKSAEVIHIDLGIAFEQGRLLKTPELVPFRLTRDIVDGMGIFGVEGPMRKSCEETMEVMRRNKESLLTIIEVFLHDPLYQWALTVEAAMQHQWDSEGTSGEVVSTLVEDSCGLVGGNLQEGKPVNAGAERALLRVKQKLDGTEDGASRTVPGQVQKLIQEARDPDKLCRMYVGWSAFL
eukprot:scaffold622_cov335-Pavlova_lutheri.AAC.6